jgi:amino acid adenylation domain-containing protein
MPTRVKPPGASAVEILAGPAAARPGGRGGADQKRQLASWRAGVADAAPGVDLPADRPRPRAVASSLDTVPFAIPADLARRLRDRCRSEGAPADLALLSAFQVFLWRHSGQEEFLIGCAGAAPGKPSDVVALIRARPDAALPFRDFLRRTDAAAREALAYRPLPAEPGLARVLFQCGPAEARPADVPRLAFTGGGNDPPASEFDLVLWLAEESGQWSGFLGYRPDLFDRSTAERFGRLYLTLLGGVADDPGRALADLPLLDEAEARRLAGFNATAREFPRDVCLHRLIEEQVRRTPDAVAVSSERGRLTYAELDRRAGQLALALRRRGVGPDTLVGVCLERSPELVLALYGILKAGGAYVPLDPDYPKDRLAFMAEDAGAPVLLTQASLAGRVPAGGATVLRLDADWPAIAADAGGPVAPPDTTADHIAYMIYTSGSTGRPKGAMVPHRGIVNRLLWMQAEYGLTAADRVLQKTPFSFDVSVWEFFWPLLAGARLVLARPGGHRDSAYLVRLIGEQGVTVLHFVPSMLQVFLDEPGLEGLTSLRHVICSGEALPWEAQEKFFARVPARLHNLYGPTEASVDVTCWECRRGDPSRAVPIGRPIWNTRIHVLDERDRPCPVGVPGELCIGGVGLGRGYHNRPELTAAKFIASPLPEDPPGARLYRTGDRARWRADGSLEYLGRFDFQVKLRGQRIEPGEIEAVLLRQPGVTAAAVALREDRPGDKRLAAYVSPAGCDAEALRGRLRAALPEYMVPATITPLAEMPLSPSGKLDRRALPAPARAAECPAEGGEYATEAERRLADIWAQVLGARPGGNDDFFEMGGDSLAAIRLCAEIGGAFGVKLSPAALFPRATVSRVVRMLGKSAGSSLVPIRTEGSRPPFFCVHALGGHALGYRVLARHLDPEQPFYGLQSREVAGGEPLDRIEEMAALYLGEVRGVQPSGPYFLGGYSMGAFVAAEMARQLSAAGERVALLALLDDGPALTHDPFRWSPAELSGFFANLPRWLAHQARTTTPLRLLADVARRVRSGLSRWRGERTVEEAVDVRRYRPEERETLARHYRALLSYRPAPFPCRATLLRARVQPLFGSHRRDMGWGRLAGGGVAVRTVTGDHAGLMDEPAAAALGREIQAAVDVAGPLYQ